MHGDKVSKTCTTEILMPTISFVLPTRHRPNLVEQCIDGFCLDHSPNVELIISDNCTDSELSCEHLVRSCKDSRVKFIKPSRPMGMVEHWNFAISHARGDYVGVLTDTMLLLPGTSGRIARVVESTGAEIVSWLNDTCFPVNIHQPLGRCRLIRAKSNSKTNVEWTMFDPVETLRQKAEASISRGRQSRSDYVSGKICFGVFSRDLIKRIEKNYRQIFHPISPDYTSMILGLGLARSSAFLASPGIVCLTTTMSNGNNCAVNDRAAFDYHQANLSWSSIGEWGVAPGLFSSESQSISADYDRMLFMLGSEISINRINWLMHCRADLLRKDRAWSSDEVRKQQLEILNRVAREFQISRHSDVFCANWKGIDSGVAWMREGEDSKIHSFLLSVRKSTAKSISIFRGLGATFNSPFDALLTRSSELT